MLWVMLWSDVLWGGGRAFAFHPGDAMLWVVLRSDTCCGVVDALSHSILEMPCCGLCFDLIRVVGWWTRFRIPSVTCHAVGCALI